MKETAEHFVTALWVELSNSDDCFHDAEALAFDGNLKEAAKMYKQSRKHFNNAVKYAKEWKNDYIEKKNSLHCVSIKQICERIHNAMSKEQDALAVKILEDYVSEQWVMRETMTISAANAGAMQNFTVWKSDVIKAIEKMLLKRFPIGERKWCLECANRIRDELLTKLRKL